MLKDVVLDDDKYLLPGVTDVARNAVELPDTVARLIERYASAVGHERVVASTDCGIGTSPALSRSPRLS